MDARINNPAGRLHMFLQHCSAAQSSVPLAAIWDGYFAHSHSSMDFATAMADLISLPQQMRSAIEGAPAAPTMPTAYLVGQVPKLDDLLRWGMFHLDSPTAHFTGKYDEGDLVRLEMASHTLMGLASTGVTDNVLDEVASLSAALTTLLVEDDLLEPDLRDLLYELSDGLRRVSESYQLRGSVAIARERDLLVGRLVNNPQLAAKLLGHKEATHVVRNIFIVTAAAMTFFNTSADTADNVPKMIDHVSQVVELIAPVGEAVHDAVQQQIALPSKP
jgi:hypothetical protein